MALFIYMNVLHSVGLMNQNEGEKENLRRKKKKEQRKTVAAVTIAKATGDWAISIEELGKNVED